MKLILQLRVIVMMLVPTLFATGCATRGLWDTKVHKPVSVPSLALSPQTEDVLVRYDEKCFFFPNGSKQLQSRAYWLFASTNRAKLHPPEFVDPTNSSD